MYVLEKSQNQTGQTDDAASILAVAQTTTKEISFWLWNHLLGPIGEKVEPVIEYTPDDERSMGAYLIDHIIGLQNRPQGQELCRGVGTAFADACVDVLIQLDCSEHMVRQLNPQCIIDLLDFLRRFGGSYSNAIQTVSILCRVKDAAHFDIKRQGDSIRPYVLEALFKQIASHQGYEQQYRKSVNKLENDLSDPKYCLAAYNILYMLYPREVPRWFQSIYRYSQSRKSMKTTLLKSTATFLVLYGKNWESDIESVVGKFPGGADDWSTIYTLTENLRSKTG